MIKVSDDLEILFQHAEENSCKASRRQNFTRNKAKYLI